MTPTGTDPLKVMSRSARGATPERTRRVGKCARRRAETPLDLRVPSRFATFGELEKHPTLSYAADNNFIVGGYRKWYDLRSCLVSLFELHNETVNVWSHLVGMVLFLLIIWQLANEGPSPIAGGAGAFGAAEGMVAGGGVAGGDLAMRSVAGGEGGDNGTQCVQGAPATLMDAMYCEALVAPSATGEHLLLGGLHTPHVLLATSVCVDSVATLELTSLPRLIADEKREFSTFKEWWQDGVNAFRRLFQHQAVVPPPLTHVSRWPMFVYVLSALVCTLFSTVYHLLSPMGPEIARKLLCLDFAGITVLVAGSFFPFIHYAFFCEPSWALFWLTGIVSLAAVVCISTFTPWFAKSEYRGVRFVMFGSLAAFAVFPILHLLWKHGFASENVGAWMPGMIRMFGLYGLGGVIYTLRIPERFSPGRFDVWAHSHQIFHICVVAAAYTWYLHMQGLYQWRAVGAMCEA